MNLSAAFKKCFCIAFIATASVICFSCGEKHVRYPITIVRTDGSQVVCSAELAVTAQERTRGFMERKNIPDGTGMLFAFPVDEKLSFWMKNTPTALSIAYIDSSGKIRDIYDMRPFSLDSVSSRTSVRYALEVPVGWFRAQHIEPGDTIVLTSDVLNHIRSVTE